jgi:CRISPR-associated protein Csm1
MNAVLLGALLHDLGKVGQRAGLSGKCHEIASSLLNPLLPHGMEDAINLASVPDAGAVLSSPGNESAKILILADWVSSGRRFDMEEFDAASPLQSIFPLVDIKKGDLPEPAYYLPKSLSIARDAIFPSDEKQEIAKAYSSLWDGLIKDLKLIQRIEDAQAYTTTLLYLLKRHTWAVPFAAAQGCQDISLYDHSRITCAIAACLMKEDLDLVSQEMLSKTTGKERFILVAGDVSGIQDFLYTITSKGAAKGLRGRSLYLQLLSEAAAKFMLRELGYPPANLIYSGGGHFYLLISSADEFRLQELKLTLERALLKMHHGDIFLALGWTHVAACDLQGTSQDLEAGLSAQWGKAMNSAGISKLQRFSLLGSQAYTEIFGLNPDEKGGKAPVCDVCKREADLWYRAEGGWYHWHSPNPEKAFCDHCKTFEKMGEHLPHMEYLIEVQGGCNDDDHNDDSCDDNLLCRFKPFGIEYYYCSKKNRRDKNEGKKDLDSLMKCFRGAKATIYSLSPDNFINENLARIAAESNAALGFRLIAKTTPMKDDGTIADLSELAERCCGIPRIGILRMDVDNLGPIFSKGLGKNANLSRISTLSTMLSLFFDGWIDKICQEWTDRAYLIYSGGDDLFIIGSWDAIPEIAMRIREDFRAFTCNNPKFSLSGAITIADEKYPLYKSAETAKRALDDAKSREKDGALVKDAISFLKETMDWTEMRISCEIAYLLKSCLTDERDGKKLPRSILWNLYSAWDLYWENRVILKKKMLSQKDTERLALHDRWRWRLIYFLDRAGGRNKAFEGDLAEIKFAILKNEWKGTFGQRSLIEYLGVPARWAELLTREVSHEPKRKE